MQVVEEKQVPVPSRHELQHPLSLNTRDVNANSINKTSNSDSSDGKDHKKSSNSRRRRRGSRRKSSILPDTSSTTIDASNKSTENSDPFFLTAVSKSNRHRRKSSSTAATGKGNYRSNQEQEEDSPAFQSLVDIISEMKRLPSISIDTSKVTQSEKAEEGGPNQWKRVRRHSEPPQKIKQHQAELKKPSILSTISEQNDADTRPIFSNSFLALEQEIDDDGENNMKESVSPLNNDKEHLIPPPKRTRSKSVPNTFLTQKPTENTSILGTTRRPLYTPHLNVPETSAAVRAHTLYSGILRVDQQDSSEAYVDCEELDGSIYIFGSRARNRALDGDEVAVELVDVDEMMNEKQAKRQARRTRRLSAMSLNCSLSFTSNGGLSSIPEDGANPYFDEEIEEIRSRPKYCGKVVCILERPRNMLFSGTLSLHRPHAKTLDNASREKKDPHSPKIIWFIPADKRLPLVAVPIKHAPADFIKYHEEYKNRIFIGNIQRWPATSLHPFGTIEKEIGWMGELGVHSGALMADHHIKDMEFSETVLKAAAAVPSDITKDDKKGRRDLTKDDLNLFTMGDLPEDLENAFSISSTEKDIYEVGIHVADVSNYIRTNTPLDREARERSCAIQLVDKQLSILPLPFIESHCSLVVDKERLAYSVMCRFTENGVLLHAWIGKTVVKVNQHLGIHGELGNDVNTLLKICRKLQHNRLQKLGGVSLAQSAVTFQLANSGYPSEIDRLNKTDDDLLMQELLIVANMEVAQKICSRFPDQALLYRQDAPKMSELTLVQDHFENEPSTNTVQGLLKLISTKETSTEKQETLTHIVRQALPTAKYFSAGSVDIAKYPHTSFGASIYTIFTEPMRNYASIHVQRQLNAALKGEKQDSDNFDVIDKIARHCNSSQLAKIAAEKDSNKLYTTAYIYRQCLNAETKKMTVESFAISFQADSIVLYLPEFDLELSVELNNVSIPGAKHVYDSTLNEMNLVWSNDDEEKDTATQTIQFLSRVDISIHVDMKVVRPLFEVELLRHDSSTM